MDDIRYEPIEERKAPDHEQKLIAEILRVGPKVAKLSPAAIVKRVFGSKTAFSKIALVGGLQCKFRFLRVSALPGPFLRRKPGGALVFDPENSVDSIHRTGIGTPAPNDPRHSPGREQCADVSGISFRRDGPNPYRREPKDEDLKNVAKTLDRLAAPSNQKDEVKPCQDLKQPSNRILQHVFKRV